MSENEPPKPAQTAEQNSVTILPLEKTQYFNGFEMGVGQSDFILTLKLNNQAITTFNFSFTTAKTLKDGLATTLSFLEAATEHTMLSIDDIKGAAAKMQAKMQEKMNLKKRTGRKSK